MSNTTSQEPAFPVEYERETLEGLTKREFFAAKALEGRLSRDAHHDSMETAKQAVQDADALIKALNR